MSMSRKDRARRKPRKRRPVRKANAGPPSPSSRRLTRRKRTAKPPATPPPEPDPRLPLWTPSGEDLEAVPVEVRQMIPAVVAPAYEQFVLQARDGLERWMGNSLVHLLWLETLHQLDLKREYGLLACIPELARVQESEIAQQLRLIESKMKIGNFLLRIRETRQRLGELARWPLPPSLAVASEATTPPPEAIPTPPSDPPKLENENAC